jgi:rod shape-determining protein MreC
LFVLLEVFAVTLIVQNNRYHQAGFFNSANFLSGVAFEKYSTVTGYFNLKSDNEKLAKENAWLRSQLPSSYYSTTFQKVEVKDTTNKQVYSYIPADVVNITTNQVNNYATINKGSNQGIKPRMAVICPDGIVGIVKDVSPHFSVVITLLNQKGFNASGRAGAEGFIGSVNWDGKDSRYAQLDEIPKQVAVKPGDKIYTGGSRFFPEGLTIGTVDKVDKNTPDNFYDIRLKLSTPYAQLRHVYVVDYLLRDEQTQLEEATHD